MASIQQAPEIQFAQRLASNEKPIRTRAIKKLRKYIRVRSQRQEGGFSNEELLKLWKGLFYCLWMQDKPLLQEELSNQIAGLLHNFVNVDMQFLYLETFLQTMKREWTGIDRLRMDKFYQLVRFLFRQTFEMLKRSGWENSLVSRFLQLLSAQILSKPAAAPSGLQIHILDLYLTELAGVGTAELNAEQNLAFIEPFCKTAAKTKDRVLLSTICSNVFRAIIDQAPFAVEDLLKEMKAAGGEDSDSGQASEEEEEEDSGQASEEDEGVQKTTSKPAGKKALKKSSTKQMNGSTSAEELDDEDEEDDELLHLEDGSDTEMADEEIGPVLQFDYGALADRLFKLASFSSSPNYNRQKLYKIIKTLRDLSEGIFPQDEYPEEVSTDEDDDEMFGSRKRMKRGRGFGEEEEDGGPSKKKAKGKKEASKPGKSDASEPVDVSDATNTKKKKKKKKRKAKTGEEKSGDVEEQTEQKEESEVKVTAVTGQEEGSEAKAMDTAPVTALQSAESDKKDIELGEPSLLKVETESSAPSEATVAVTSIETEGPSEPSEPDAVVVGSQTVVTITDSDDEPAAPVTEGNQDQSETRTIEEEPVNQLEVQLLETASSKKKKGKKGKLTSAEPSVEVAEDQPAPGTHEEEPAEGAAETGSIPEITMTTTPETAPTNTPETAPTSTPEITITPETAPTSTPEITITPETAPTSTPATKKKRRKSNKLQETEESEPSVEVAGDQPEAAGTHNDAPAEEKAETESIPETTTTSTPGAKKRRRKSNKLQEPEQTVEMEAKASEESEPRVEAAEVQPAAPETHNEEAADGAAETEPTPEIATTTTPEIAPTTTPGAKKKRRKSNKLQEPEKTAEVEAKSSEAELDHVSSLPAVAETATEDTKATPRKTKKKAKLRDTTQEEGVETETTPAETPEGAAAADEVPADATPLKKKKNKKSKAAMDQVAEEDVEPQLDAEATGTEEQATPIKKKKRKASAEKEAKIQSEVEESGEHDELPAALKKKKKRKYPVVVEVEADELEAAAEAARLNGLAGSGGKKSKMSNEPSSSMSTKKAPKLKVKKNKGNDFITFQGSAAVPTALFCRTPPSGSKKCQTPKSDSKKVTFGLMNNKTTEFRKNDRSLLVSPEGSSRVPFNPEQKPVCGVLKFSSPASTKKIPKIRKTPGRPTAADFF